MSCKAIFLSLLGTILKYRLWHYIGQIYYICPLISIKHLLQIKCNLKNIPITIIIQAKREILLLATGVIAVK